MNIKKFLFLFIGYGNVDTAPQIINHKTKEIQNINETEINNPKIGTHQSQIINSENKNTKEIIEKLDLKTAVDVILGYADKETIQKCYDLSDKTWYPFFSQFCFWLLTYFLIKHIRKQEWGTPYREKLTFSNKPLNIVLCLSFIFFIVLFLYFCFKPEKKGFFKILYVIFTQFYSAFIFICVWAYFFVQTYTRKHSTIGFFYFFVFVLFVLLLCYFFLYKFLDRTFEYLFIYIIVFIFFYIQFIYIDLREKNLIVTVIFYILYFFIRLIFFFVVCAFFILKNNIYPFFLFVPPRNRDRDFSSEEHVEWQKSYSCIINKLLCYISDLFLMYRFIKYLKTNNSKRIIYYYLFCFFWTLIFLIAFTLRVKGLF